MNKEPARSGFEEDATTGWRKYLCYMQRPGIARRAKNQINRRLRRKERKEVENSLDMEE